MYKKILDKENIKVQQKKPKMKTPTKKDLTLSRREDQFWVNLKIYSIYRTIAISFFIKNYSNWCSELIWKNKSERKNKKIPNSGGIKAPIYSKILKHI